MLDKLILDGDQVACLASPIRAEILHAMRFTGPASINELADFMGVSPQSLHYHIRALTRANLVHVKETRLAGKRHEAVYQQAAKQYALAPGKQEPEYAEGIRRHIVAALRSTEREYCCASVMAERDPRTRDYMHVQRVSIRLAPEDAETLLGMLAEVAEWARARHQPDAGERLSLTTVLTPLLRR